ncbi:MAG: hypothetical protein M1834_005981 [Cirrosporium novae-zelandiae]|nr:MAG: hypothetical protein M1834_005981 [Cirrosporium novae-zelandiae]
MGDPAHHAGTIQPAPTNVDDAEDPLNDTSEVDSTLGDETYSLTDTVNSQNYQHRYLVDGRRTHGFEEAAYFLPNDEREQDRLNLQHLMWRISLDDKLHEAPIKEDVHNILDIATGSGIWAIEMADKYPSAKVTGTDLRSVPPNCFFIVEDSDNQEWIFNDKFDLIHSRALTSAWSDWPRYLRNCYQFLTPGGWLELHDAITHLGCANGPSPNLGSEWGKLLADACALKGVDTLRPGHLETDLEAAGFINITKKHIRWPINPWSDDPKEKELGRLFEINEDLEGIMMGALTRGLGWSREEVEVWLVGARKGWHDRSLHNYLPM